MAIPRRTQAVPLTRSTDRPAYLADLPHVGEKLASNREQRTLPAATSSSEQPTVSTHPAFAEIIALDRGRSHPVAPGSVGKLFLDRAHVAEDDYEGYEASVDRRPADPQPSRQHRRGWRRLFSQAHNLLAPFAGLIVTLALLTSAGLLFWLISRGQPAELDLRDLEYYDGALSIQISESEPASSAIPADQALEATEAVQEPTGATQAAAPVEKPVEPIVEESVQASSPDVTASIPLGQISFPTTSTPFAFDYSKAFDTATAESSEKFHGLPEVAERENSSAENSVAR
ncbi:hypothetical protein [Bythopirellula goksoeyrii]|uniref:Uncharacterized protein n=1 Tax=Bythopirellula goksoeyrii TaxID=1400387 RepID=A0A5B9QFN1_9BACT|nr:hypothetical protein [Bythopirellula goksoeyrii]QEG33141.1 hypothetical protein Pr1d_04020 [Bythopirellula goksoeyrii]